DAHLGGQPRQVLAVVPVRLGQLLRVDADLAGGVAGGEADHELVRERPGLAAEVAQVADLDPRFLVDLARDRLLPPLARLDEAGQHAEDRLSEGAVARQQDAILALDAHDHRRAEPREAQLPAARALHGALGLGPHGRLAAAAAEAVAALPLHDLAGAAG